MNYRHHYHAGNFADVFKHVLLGVLVRAMQRKEKGFLYLDTHAGRGGYELETAQTLPGGGTRAPEWPEGIGKLWGVPVLPALTDYVAAVADYQHERTGAAVAGGPLAHYPGSPWLAARLLREQDRAMFCELRPDDAEALDLQLSWRARVSVQTRDGYEALRAVLPPVERRALVLVDPPFESGNEFAEVTRALREALRRLPGGVYAVWYPLTARASGEDALAALASVTGTPALQAELRLGLTEATVGLSGCGLFVFNPPWRVEEEFRATLEALRAVLGRGPQAQTRLTWPVPEK